MSWSKEAPPTNPANDLASAGMTAQTSSTAGSSTADTASMTTDDISAPNNQSRSWSGWAELENDPVIFTTLLREWGVPNIQVNEVVPLDSVFDTPPYVLGLLGRGFHSHLRRENVFGLIFLSRWMPAETENTLIETPGDVWFANQTSSFSCASVALMNIINNHANLDLGQALNHFRAKTMNMTPKERGIALDRFDHVRDVHNSFAAPFDKMNVDLRLKQDVAAAEKKKKAAMAKRPRKKLKEEEEEECGDGDNGFHFVAYVPAGGFIWRMDGMERLPRKLGALSPEDNWVALVLPELQAQWETASTTALEFSLLSLTVMTDSSSLEADRIKMERVREDWGPFIAQMVRLHAEKGDLKGTLG
ncbi:uncharacterized protein Z518_10202 [Rhinocladiella mackenziei CBS 650.93]|uniref:ubiquitinyl hydrolase 1 n=1 Tax=Rhinocladiella mackenziei CBS 650.93 TaxID=1442369 RepID=A0A0D2ID26_9EURO|nr:uncharacterized protein Z518_10202 [Rhinocladiella mackenziei CBS 650.93]KIX01136.1 hypothetical protein Z518_10202 [Rhinocladiella mackenziei CBS 650.93]